MTEIEAEASKATIQFQANVSSIKTGIGTWKVTLDLFENQFNAIMKLPEFYQKSVQVALVILPEED